ncbi:MAG: metal-dependent hydrolase [Candidatus Bathyarchaeia archaeon]
MDVLTHVFLPLTLVYVLRGEFKVWYFPLVLFAVLPDFDVFTGIHRGLFHSLLFLLPLASAMLGLECLFKRSLEFSVLAVGFMFSHIFLDFLIGGVPLLYPLVNRGVGVEFPFVLRFGESVSIVDVMPKIVYNVPREVYGEMDAFSGFGIAIMAVFIIICLKSWREKVYL